jgi:hypothetical protein
MWKSFALGAALVVAAVSLASDASAACKGGILTTTKSGSAYRNVEVVAEVTMTSGDRGCVMSVPVSSRAAIDKPPAHGTATYDSPRITYRPTPGYIGQDEFLASGRSSNGRVNIIVYVTITK